MKSILLRLFDVEKSEVRSVLLLMFQAFFLGLFFGSFQVSAESLFILAFDKSQFGQAYAVSSGVGIVLTVGYIILQQRIAFKTLSIINILGIFLIVSGLVFGYHNYESKWLIFTHFILLGPLIILSTQKTFLPMKQQSRKSLTILALSIRLLLTRRFSSICYTEKF